MTRAYGAVVAFLTGNAFLELLSAPTTVDAPSSQACITSSNEDNATQGDVTIAAISLVCAVLREPAAVEALHEGPSQDAQCRLGDRLREAVVSTLQSACHGECDDGNVDHSGRRWHAARRGLAAAAAVATSAQAPDLVVGLLASEIDLHGTATDQAGLTVEDTLLLHVARVAKTALSCEQQAEGTAGSTSSVRHGEPRSGATATGLPRPGERHVLQAGKRALLHTISLNRDAAHEGPQRIRRSRIRAPSCDAPRVQVAAGLEAMLLLRLLATATDTVDVQLRQASSAVRHTLFCQPQCVLALSAAVQAAQRLRGGSSVDDALPLMPWAADFMHACDKRAAASATALPLCSVPVLQRSAQYWSKQLQSQRARVQRSM